MSSGGQSHGLHGQTAARKDHVLHEPHRLRGGGGRLPRTAGVAELWERGPGGLFPRPAEER